MTTMPKVERHGSKFVLFWGSYGSDGWANSAVRTWCRVAGAMRAFFPATLYERWCENAHQERQHLRLLSAVASVQAQFDANWATPFKNDGPEPRGCLLDIGPSWTGLTWESDSNAVNLTVSRGDAVMVIKPFTPPWREDPVVFPSRVVDAFRVIASDEAQFNELVNEHLSPAERAGHRFSGWSAKQRDADLLAVTAE